MSIVFSDGKGRVMLSDGKWYNQFTGKPLFKSHKRYRATAVIFNDYKVLLVRDRGKKDYSFPGGGFKKNETTIQAGIREIKEELKLNVTSAIRARHCDLQGRRANHKVVLLEIKGTPQIKINYRELDSFIWWDMKEKLPVQGHVIYILKKLGKL